jgi:hypothetical protein
MWWSLLAVLLAQNLWQILHNNDFVWKAEAKRLFAELSEGREGFSSALQAKSTISS